MLHATAGDLDDPRVSSRLRADDPVLGRSIWTYSHTVLGMVGIFFYVGVEIALAAIGIRFFQEQGISSVETAGIAGYALLPGHHGGALSSAAC